MNNAVPHYNATNRDYEMQFISVDKAKANEQIRGNNRRDEVRPNRSLLNGSHGELWIKSAWITSYKHSIR